MKITQFELLKVPPSWIWLRIHTDAGITGLGEPFLENHPESVIAEVQRLEPFLIGQDPRRIEALWETMYNAGLGYKGGPVTMSALSGNLGYSRALNPAAPQIGHVSGFDESHCCASAAAPR